MVAQLYQSPEMKEKVKSLGMEVLEYDACSTIWVKTWEDWVEFSSSEEYQAGESLLRHSRGVGSTKEMKLTEFSLDARCGSFHGLQDKWDQGHGRVSYSLPAFILSTFTHIPTYWVN